MREILLQVEKLHVRMGSFQIQDISFHLKKGDYMVLLGPTGSGKTVLLECLAGLVPVDQGEIFLHGQSIKQQPPEQRRFGFAYQDSLLFPFLSVEENILFAAANLPSEKREKLRLERMSEITRRLEIDHLLKRRPKGLSGGEKQRVSLARAILLKPELLLLDEPLSALDPRTRVAMQKLLKELHQQEQISVIHVTHNLGEAFSLASRILVINHGEMQQLGTPGEIILDPCTEEVKRLVDAELEEKKWILDYKERPSK